MCFFLLFDYDLFFNGLTKESKYPELLDKELRRHPLGRINDTANNRENFKNFIGTYFDRQLWGTLLDQLGIKSEFKVEANGIEKMIFYKETSRDIKR